MTEKYFFDTDCLSAFLWVREESILARLYAGRIVLPTQVYNELQRVPHLLARVDTLKNNGDLSIASKSIVHMIHNKPSLTITNGVLRLLKK